MVKEESLEFTGIVIELLPNAMFKVKLENNHEVLAHTSGRIRKNRIRVLVGDKVDVEMTPGRLNVGMLAGHGRGQDQVRIACCIGHEMLTDDCEQVVPLQTFDDLVAIGCLQDGVRIEYEQ